MLPKTSFNMSELQEVKYSDKDYRMDINKKMVAGTVNALEAVKQSAYKILNTERYENIIYSWNYGVELKDLFGMPMSYVQPEIKRRFEEALMQDDRIKEVSDFTFNVKGNELSVSLIVTCDYGKFTAERVVVV